VSLSPGRTRQLDLAQALAAQGIRGPLDDAGVDITYTGPQGSVVGRLTCFDQTGDFAFDVPVKDPLAGMSRAGGSYPWRLDGGYTTVMHLKNTVKVEVSAIVQVRYADGNYNPELVRLAPFQTVAIDIGAFRNDGKKDVRGGVMPEDVEGGQVIWYERTPGSLIGRAEVLNVAEGIASSFSCGGGGCTASFDTAPMSPASASEQVGDANKLFTAQEKDKDCQGIYYGPYNVTSGVTWSSTNTSAATVASDGTVTGVAEGSSTILASYFAKVYACGNNCSETTVNPAAAGSLTITCKLPTGETATNNGWSGSAGLWNQTLAPSTKNFSGRTVTEQDPGGGGPDTCWFSGSTFAAFTAITGGSWTVASGNTYGPDNVGYSDGAITYYRAQQRAPCSTTFSQRMVINCANQNTAYATNTLGAGIGVTTISSTKNGSTVSKTYP